MVLCLKGRVSFSKFCTKDTLNSSVSIWQGAGEPDLALPSFHTSDVSDFRRNAKPESNVFQLSVCDHNPLMQNRPRTTLIRVGVRQKNKELNKFHSCTSNELDEFLRTSSWWDAAALPCPPKSLKGILQSHWGRNSSEGSNRGVHKLSCCQASSLLPVL